MRTYFQRATNQSAGHLLPADHAVLRYASFRADPKSHSVGMVANDMISTANAEYIVDQTDSLSYSELSLTFAGFYASLFYFEWVGDDLHQTVLHSSTGCFGMFPTYANDWEIRWMGKLLTPFFFSADAEHAGEPVSWLRLNDVIPSLKMSELEHAAVFGLKDDPDSVFPHHVMCVNNIDNRFSILVAVMAQPRHWCCACLLPCSLGQPQDCYRRFSLSIFVVPLCATLYLPCLGG